MVSQQALSAATFWDHVLPLLPSSFRSLEASGSYTPYWRLRRETQFWRICGSILLKLTEAFVVEVTQWPCTCAWLLFRVWLAAAIYCGLPVVSFRKEVVPASPSAHVFRCCSRMPIPPVPLPVAKLCCVCTAICFWAAPAKLGGLGSGLMFSWQRSSQGVHIGRKVSFPWNGCCYSAGVSPGRTEQALPACQAQPWGLGLEEQGCCCRRLRGKGWDWCDWRTSGYIWVWRPQKEDPSVMKVVNVEPRSAPQCRKRALTQLLRGLLSGEKDLSLVTGGKGPKMMEWLEEISGAHHVQGPHSSIFMQSKLARTLSRQLLKVRKDGESNKSLGY